MNNGRKQWLQDAKMLFTSKELAFAAGASSPNLFLNNIGRYNFQFQLKSVFGVPITTRLTTLEKHI